MAKHADRESARARKACRPGKRAGQKGMPTGKARGPFYNWSHILRGSHTQRVHTWSVWQAMSCCQKDVTPVVRELRLFCKRSGVLKGKFLPWGGRSGCFASEAEFSKGSCHFASVITLAKCCIPVKAEVSL